MPPIEPIRERELFRKSEMTHHLGVKEEMVCVEKSTKRNGTLRDKAYVAIKNAIITARLEPNCRIVEEAMAADIGASRTPIREALQKLEIEGLIFKLPSSGFAVKGVTEEEVEDILGLQCVVEFTIEVYELLNVGTHETAFLVLNEAIEKRDLLLADPRYRETSGVGLQYALHRAAKNTRLYELVRGLRDCIDRYRVIVFRSHARLHLSVKDHKKMVGLVRTKNTRQIEKVISRHMTRGKNVIKRKIERDRGGRSDLSDATYFNQKKDP